MPKPPKKKAKKQIAEMWAIVIRPRNGKAPLGPSGFNSDDDGVKNFYSKKLAVVERNRMEPGLRYRSRIVRVLITEI